jgi:hypothetical protein
MSLVVALTAVPTRLESHRLVGAALRKVQEVAS